MTWRRRTAILKTWPRVAPSLSGDWVRDSQASHVISTFQIANINLNFGYNVIVTDRCEA